MADDKLTAALDEIREVGYENATSELLFTLAFRQAARNVVRLLAAVDAVLARHVPKVVTHVDICAAHSVSEHMRRLPYEDERAIIDGCPDCVTRQVAECAACDPVCPDDNVWPCPTVQAISRALLGEDRPETVTGASGAEYIIGDPIGLAPDAATPCDAAEWGGFPTMGPDGSCRCTVCPRCGHHTGNSHQGHYWAYCNVTGTTREFHMCCPDPEFGCELGEDGT